MEQGIWMKKNETKNEKEKIINKQNKQTKMKNQQRKKNPKK